MKKKKSAKSGMQLEAFPWQSMAKRQSGWNRPREEKKNYIIFYMLPVQSL